MQAGCSVCAIVTQITYTRTFTMQGKKLTVQLTLVPLSSSDTCVQKDNKCLFFFGLESDVILTFVLRWAD